MKTSTECRSSAKTSPCARSVALAGFPGTQAWPPGRHCAPVGLVISAEAAREGGFLVEADERRYGHPDDTGVQ
jgi:hypothetical protein